MFHTIILGSWLFYMQSNELALSLKTFWCKKYHSSALLVLLMAKIMKFHKQHSLLQQAQHPPILMPSQLGWALLFFPSDHIPMLCKFSHQFDRPLSSLCVLHKVPPKQSPFQQEHTAALDPEPSLARRCWALEEHVVMGFKSLIKTELIGYH